MARKLGVRLRQHSPEVGYYGGFYGQSEQGTPLNDAIGVESLLRILRDLPAGVTELGCHPGLADDVQTAYQSERQREVETLCDPRVRAFIRDQGIELRSSCRTPAYG
jgi:hypothetical protein